MISSIACYPTAGVQHSHRNQESSEIVSDMIARQLSTLPLDVFVSLMVSDSIKLMMPEKSSNYACAEVAA